MMSVFARKMLCSLMVALLSVAFGCESGEESVTVDFGRTLSHIGSTTESDADRKAIRVAVGAMVSPLRTIEYYQRLLEYLGTKLGKRLEMVQKKTYAEINEMLIGGEVEVAFICSGPYAIHGMKAGFKLLAAPQVKGRSQYQAYLIVHKDAPYTRIEDLEGKTFAFTDPDSNTGRMVPTFWLAELNKRPKDFFGKVVYTHAHDNSIMAVAKGLVDGASVDGLIWDYHHTEDPAFTSRTKVIKRSRPFGIPPVVGSAKLSVEDAEAIRKFLISMHEDPEGEKILARLHIDRFVPAKEEWYQSVRDIYASGQAD
ncbi:MAG: phosphate/phosphite/phosphonate ABC transporter substrate-binding protein [Deltaproteobacteria bacterium]|nr:phosphate/phosphite/phosphonate ABC transporter substrate-binding protein [Deltaproteobacteria bacterium]